MHEKITIDSKFNDPPDSGNGGYVCGLLANFIGLEAEVTLRKRPPLEKPLSISVRDDGLVAPEFIWTSLDCPGCFAVVESQEIIALPGPMSVQ
ncbi:MAG: hypothetical protein BMS9Abin02_0913 [Anaerolineae bacterium]|nr:MAG: hypothetical protein BMS9Abin02_0913 [Anaerolineae bacterium]